MKKLKFFPFFISYLQSAMFSHHDSSTSCEASVDNVSCKKLQLFDFSSLLPSLFSIIDLLLLVSACFRIPKPSIEVAVQFLHN